MDKTINTEETLPNDETLEGDVSTGSENVESVHELLSKELGKDFKDDESALKSIKDTFKYVGKVGQVLPAIEKLKEKFGSESAVLDTLAKMEKGETKESPIDTKGFVSQEKYDKDTFFNKNPEHEANRELLDALRTNNPDKNLSELVEMPVYKNIFDKATKYDKSESSKSVLVSNPKLGQATDNISKAKEYAKAGDINAASDAATKAVMDAYEL